MLGIMGSLGNGITNQVYESRISGGGFDKPKGGCGRVEAEDFIRRKYVSRSFVGLWGGGGGGGYP